jgi:tetratricopeptide (TPR) repeat protein
MHPRAVLALLAGASVVAAFESPNQWNNLGAERFRAGDTAGAEKLYLRALAGWQQAGEPRSEARTVSNLAVVYRAQGRYREAETMYQNALRMLERTHSGESAEAATTLNNLAELYRVCGEPARGEPYALRAVALEERLFGAGHPATAEALHTLAAIARDRGRLDEAIALYHRAGAVLESTPGARSNPLLARNLANVAEIRLAQGAYAEAESASRDALAVADASFGPRDPARAQSLNNLAQALRFERRFEEAEPLYQETIALLGRDAAAAGHVVANLAGAYHDQERESRAVELYTRALALLEASLGAGHPETELVRTRFAEVRRAQGHYAQSLDLYRHAVPLLERSYGPDDPRVMAALHDFKRTEAEAKQHIVEVLR